MRKGEIHAFTWNDTDFNKQIIIVNKTLTAKIKQNTQEITSTKINPITINEFRHSHVSLMINKYIKTGQTDTAKFFIMMSARKGHTIKVMQEAYLHLFPNVQNEIVNLIENLNKQDQKQDKKK